MPLKKKTTKRGRKPAEYTEYQDKSDKEKRSYHTNAVRKHRGSSPLPSSSSTTETTPTGTPTSSRRSSAGNSSSRGRPPLMGLVAMTPRTLQGRKRHLMSEKRKQNNRSKKSKAAAKLRFSSLETTDAEFLSSDDDTETPLDLTNDTTQGDEQLIHALTPPTASTLTPDALRKSIYRAKCRLRGVFTNDSLDNLKLLHLLNKENLLPSDFSGELSKMDCVFSSDLRKYKCRVSRLIELFGSISSDVLKPLLQFWIENILLSKVAESIFTSCNVIIADDLLPKSVTVIRNAATIANKYVSVSSKLPKDIRVTGTNYIIDVAKQNNLQCGDATILSSATNCSIKFARKVLTALNTGTEEQLKKLRKERFDSIHVTEWPSKIAEFVFRPENSRATPGQDTVSVSYGVRKPKYILLHSRSKIAHDFKTAYPDCKFATSTIKREFPPNAITPTSRDNERNTCPTHANIRRIIRALNNTFRKNNVPLLPSSCRELCTRVMCSSETVLSEEPISWIESCVLGTCKQCPPLQIVYPTELGVKEVKFSTWESHKVKVTKTNQKTKKVCTFEKNIFSLYPKTMSLDQTVKQLKSMIQNLKLHIFTAHKQWNAHKILRSNLVPGSIITIEDYQMNLEVSYGEAPTSTAYSANKIALAMYPLVVEYLNDEGELCKGGIVFLSEDKLHDHQQIEEFEKKAFEIFEKYIPYKIVNWKRFSDGCGAQFWSGFVIANLFKMKGVLGLTSISYDRFEANEGKSISDTLGSISKCAFLRGIVKTDEGIADLSEVIELIKSELNVSTKKFTFFEIIPFDFIERSTSRSHLSIQDVSKLHSVALNGTKVISHKWTCTDCTVSELCDACKLLTGTSQSSIITKQSKQTQNDAEKGDTPEQFYDNDDNGQTDDEDEEEDQVESDEDSTDEEEDEFQPGDIVWGLHGRQWYPGVLCSVNDVPEDIRHKFRSIDNSYIIFWYGEEKYSLVTKVENLGITQLDAKRASRSGAIQKLYNKALSDMI